MTQSVDIVLIAYLGKRLKLQFTVNPELGNRLSSWIFNYN